MHYIFLYLMISDINNMSGFQWILLSNNRNSGDILILQHVHSKLFQPLHLRDDK